MAKSETEIDAEHKRQMNKEYKRKQRLRDIKLGISEKTYRATDPEHTVLNQTLKELRK